MYGMLEARATSQALEQVRGKRAVGKSKMLTVVSLCYCCVVLDVGAIAEACNELV